MAQRLTEPISLYLTEDDKTALEARAIEEDRSMSAVIRRAIAQYLAREESK